MNEIDVKIGDKEYVGFRDGNTIWKITIWDFDTETERECTPDEYTEAADYFISEGWYVGN